MSASLHAVSGRLDPLDAGGWGFGASVGGLARGGGFELVNRLATIPHNGANLAAPQLYPMAMPLPKIMALLWRAERWEVTAQCYLAGSGVTVGESSSGTYRWTLGESGPLLNGSGSLGGATLKLEYLDEDENVLQEANFSGGGAYTGPACGFDHGRVAFSYSESGGSRSDVLSQPALEKRLIGRYIEETSGDVVPWLSSGPHFSASGAWEYGADNRLSDPWRYPDGVLEFGVTGSFGATLDLQPIASQGSSFYPFLGGISGGGGFAFREETIFGPMGHDLVEISASFNADVLPPSSSPFYPGATNVHGGGVAFQIDGVPAGSALLYLYCGNPDISTIFYSLLLNAIMP